VIFFLRWLFLLCSSQLSKEHLATAGTYVCPWVHDKWQQVFSIWVLPFEFDKILTFSINSLPELRKYLGFKNNCPVTPVIQIPIECQMFNATIVGAQIVGLVQKYLCFLLSLALNRPTKWCTCVVVFNFFKHQCT